MKVYGDHTYDIYANFKYREILLAIEDTQMWAGDQVEKYSDKKSQFELITNKHVKTDPENLQYAEWIEDSHWAAPELKKKDKKKNSKKELPTHPLEDTWDNF